MTTEYYCNEMKNGATFYKVLKRSAKFVTVIAVKSLATKQGVIPSDEILGRSEPLRRKIFNFSKSKDKAAEHIEIDMGTDAYLWGGEAVNGYLAR